MESETRTKLITIFGEAIVSAATEMEPIYGPAIGKLGWRGLIELDALARAKKVKEAADLLHANMTGEALAEEKKSVIGPMLVKMADDNAEGWNLGKSILMGGLSALAAASIPGVFF